ncbi:MAG TPA: hypothetical protein VNZ45_15690 [Bacteroidia bacterium]|nr:hypothetical protein [Bacteroidia bacterium]
MKDRINIMEDMNKKHIASIEEYECLKNDTGNMSTPNQENDFDDEMFSDSIYLS